MSEAFSLAAISNWFRLSRAHKPSDSSTDAEYQALAVSEEAVQQEPLQTIPEEMGFQEQFEMPEGRDGDALAQIIAAVCVLRNILKSIDLHKLRSLSAYAFMCRSNRLLAPNHARDTDNPRLNLGHHLLERHIVPVVRMAPGLAESGYHPVHLW